MDRGVIFFMVKTPYLLKEQPLIATKRMGGSRAQVSRPEYTENPAHHKGALRTATINAERKKAPHAGGTLRRVLTRATKPDR